MVVVIQKKGRFIRSHLCICDHCNVPFHFSNAGALCRTPRYAFARNAIDFQIITLVTQTRTGILCCHLASGAALSAAEDQDVSSARQEALAEEEAAADEGMERNTRDFSRILKRGGSTFSRILKRAPGFSRISRGQPAGFSRILRSPASFSRILRSPASFSRILRFF